MREASAGRGWIKHLSEFVRSSVTSVALQARKKAVAASTDFPVMPAMSDAPNPARTISSAMLIPQSGRPSYTKVILYSVPSQPVEWSLMLTE